jgi:hypothetical protein
LSNGLVDIRVCINGDQIVQLFLIRCVCLTATFVKLYLLVQSLDRHNFIIMMLSTLCLEVFRHGLGLSLNFNRNPSIIQRTSTAVTLTWRLQILTAHGGRTRPGRTRAAQARMVCGITSITAGSRN